MTASRGAWPKSGLGGTLNVDRTGPGMYYTLGVDGRGAIDENQKCVQGAVKAIQRNLDLEADGFFGKATYSAAIAFQTRAGLTADGLLGPVSMPVLFRPLLEQVVADNGLDKRVTPTIVSGFCRTESAWDPGARGGLDPDDYGLGQIHLTEGIDITIAQAMRPAFAFDYITKRIHNALDTFDGDMTLALASYNLGVGGARVWNGKGRPNPYTPVGSDRPRDVLAYVSKILAG